MLKQNDVPPNKCRGRVCASAVLNPRQSFDYRTFPLDENFGPKHVVLEN